MNGFYVSMVFLGIILVGISLVCILLDKKKAFGFFKSYDAKKQELAEIISDAEEMVDELNRFSDYIINQMEQKNEELQKNLKLAEEKAGALSERLKLISNSADEADEADEALLQASCLIIENCMTGAISAISSEQISDNEATVAAAVNGRMAGAAPAGNYARTGRGGGMAALKTGNNSPAAPVRKNDKVIPINKKYSEVLRLSDEGVQSLDIAKRLNMGKGEVELILGLRK